MVIDACVCGDGVYRQGARAVSHYAAKQAVYAEYRQIIGVFHNDDDDKLDIEHSGTDELSVGRNAPRTRAAVVKF